MNYSNANLLTTSKIKITLIYTDDKKKNLYSRNTVTCTESLIFFFFFVQPKIYVLAFYYTSCYWLRIHLFNFLASLVFRRRFNLTANNTQLLKNFLFCLLGTKHHKNLELLPWNEGRFFFQNQWCFHVFWTVSLNPSFSINSMGILSSDAPYQFERFYTIQQSEINA